MTMPPQRLPSPVEARLRKTPLAVTCDLVDEAQRSTPLAVQSVHMHGAKQEVTATMRGRGYLPRGRWEPPSPEATYASRVFGLADEGEPCPA